MFTVEEEKITIRRNPRDRVKQFQKTMKKGYGFRFISICDLMIFSNSIEAKKCFDFYKKSARFKTRDRISCKLKGRVLRANTDSSILEYSFVYQKK